MQLLEEMHAAILDGLKLVDVTTEFDAALSKSFVARAFEQLTFSWDAAPHVPHREARDSDSEPEPFMVSKARGINAFTQRHGTRGTADNVAEIPEAYDHLYLPPIMIATNPTERIEDILAGSLNTAKLVQRGAASLVGQIEIEAINFMLATARKANRVYEEPSLAHVLCNITQPASVAVHSQDARAIRDHFGDAVLDTDDGLMRLAGIEVDIYSCDALKAGTMIVCLERLGIMARRAPAYAMPASSPKHLRGGCVLFEQIGLGITQVGELQVYTVERFIVCNATSDPITVLRADGAPLFEIGPGAEVDLGTLDGKAVKNSLDLRRRLTTGQIVRIQARKAQERRVLRQSEPS
ncbi:MAG: hypothetical protein ACAH95_13905 [Fimbriimonas sp.]